jgi:carboxyl-terminal processing protease
MRRACFAFLVAASVTPPTGLLAQAKSDTVPLAERAWVAGKLYSAVQRYFSHWEGVPDLDVDSAYRAYLDEALDDADRYRFSLASMAFLASLRNGHSDFNDSWLWRTRGQPLGFRLAPVHGSWVVVESRIAALPIGAIVSAIDGVETGSYLARLERYVSASDERARVRKLFYRPFLFPDELTLTLGDGGTLAVRRGAQTLEPQEPPVMRRDTVGEGIPYLYIPSFGEPRMERDAVAFVTANADAPAMIIDVRRNGGGTTPTALIKALMTVPYRDWTETTSFSIALYGAYRHVRSLVQPDQLDDYTKGYLDAFASYEHPTLTLPGSLNPPDQPVYSGRLIIVADDACASACEDFLLPFKVSGRATIVGERTAGSTGQPYMYVFPNGMNFRVSAKRVYFPDGSPFEGVGIVPDVEVAPSLQDLRLGSDPALSEAVAMAAARGR